MKKITLIACTSRKNHFKDEAQHVYRSEIFKYASLYAKHTSDKWFILSGKHFLLKPTTTIKPYQTLSVSERSRPWRFWWSHQVYEMLKSELTSDTVVEFICGLRYRSFLVDFLMRDGYMISVPYENLGIGDVTSILRNISNSFD